MPFKSKAQQRKLEMLTAQGKFGKGNIKEWEDSTDFSKLPERVKPKTRGKAKIQTRPSRGGGRGKKR